MNFGNFPRENVEGLTETEKCQVQYLIAAAISNKAFMPTWNRLIPYHPHGSDYTQITESTNFSILHAIPDSVTFNFF